MTTQKKTNILLLILCLCSFIGQLLIYPSLPETIPTHWNLAGEVDDWSNKSTSLFLGLLLLFFWLLMAFLPKIDPRKENYEKHKKPYTIVTFILILFLIGVNWITLAIALGTPISIEKVIPIGIGLLFLILGIYMPQFQSNYYIGIKTPWTLESPTVWAKTHKAGGYVFCSMGVFLILAGILAIPFLSKLCFYYIVAATAGLIFYSYYLYKEENPDRK